MCRVCSYASDPGRSWFASTALQQRAQFKLATFMFAKVWRSALRSLLLPSPRMPSQPSRPPAPHRVMRSEARTGNTASGGHRPQRGYHALQRVAGTSQTSHERRREKPPPELESSLGQAHLLLLQCPHVAKPQIFSSFALSHPSAGQTPCKESKCPLPAAGKHCTGWSPGWGQRWSGECPLLAVT